MRELIRRIKRLVGRLRVKSIKALGVEIEVRPKKGKSGLSSPGSPGTNSTTPKVEFNLFFKSKGERRIQQHGSYEAEPEEWQRLKKDFSAFIDHGEPNAGTYLIYFNSKRQEKVLSFSELSSIG